MTTSDTPRGKDPLQQWSDDLTARKKLNAMAEAGMVTEQPVSVGKPLHFKRRQP